MSSCRTVLADDHALVRAGLSALLRGIDGVQIVGEAGSGREVLEQVKQHRPDLVLMDIAMAGMNGIEATARMSKAFPKTRVIVLSMHTHEEWVRRALCAGAAGYLVKGDNIAELETAVKVVSAGGTFLSSSVPRHLLRDYIPPAGGKVNSLHPLTPRQREILQLVAEGHTTQSIAKQLFLSVKTVETHRAHLMHRLGIRDVAGLVRYAVRTGVITPEE